MDARYDIDFDADYITANNDVACVASDQQHIEDTIKATPGAYKESPADGVDIDKYLNSSGQEQIVARSILLQLQSDGYTVTRPSVQFDANGRLIINPNATLS